MYETNLKKMHPTETILKAMPAFIEAFVAFYGEEERERITKKFTNMLVIGYSQPSSISNIIRENDKEKNEEIINEFLRKLSDSIEEQEKLKKWLLKDNSFEYSSLQPINYYILYLNNPDISDYIKNNVVNFLKQYHSETTMENLDELIANGTFKSIDTIIDVYKESLEKYKKYKLEIKPYQDYVDKCSDLRNTLNKKYQKILIEELKDLFTEEEYQQIQEKMNSKYYYSIQDVNSKTKNYISYSLNGAILIDAFSEKSEEILRTGKEWRKESIKKDRIKYFKNLGIDLGDDYDVYLNDERVKSLIPSKELIERLNNTHKELYTKMMNEFYTSLPEYKENIARIEQLDLLDKEYGYNANAYERRGTFVSTNIKLVNGEYIEYPLFNIYIGNMEEYLDHAIVHELNHAYELTFKSMENNVCTLHCGWDILSDTISSQSQETVSLDERTEKRNYELFNEIINELIAQEISEIMSQMGTYVFNTKEDKKITGSTSYERTRFLVKNFYETYKKEILESRKYGNLEIIYNAVGKENFEELNQLFYEYNEHFNIGLGMLKVYEDLENNVETELTKKFKDLVARRNNILAKMEEHNMSKSQTR